MVGEHPVLAAIEVFADEDLDRTCALVLERDRELLDESVILIVDRDLPALPRARDIL